MKQALITGAAGFIGRQLLKSIGGWNAKAVVRRRGSTADPRTEAAAITIDRNTDWSDLLRDVDCVVHLAAHVHVMAPTVDDRQRFHEVNVLGTERLAQQAAACGVKRFIFLSSVKVNGEGTQGSPFTARDRPAPQDDYGMSKWEAEQRLIQIARDSAMTVVAIRSPLVYGPGVRANFFRLLSSVHKGVPLPFGAIRNKRSMVSVWNLCDLILRAMDAVNLQSDVFMISDGEDLSTAELIRRLAHAMNRAPRLVSVPVGALKLLGAVTGRRAEIARLVGSLAVDISETRRVLDWTPPVTVAEGLNRTARWYLEKLHAGRD